MQSQNFVAESNPDRWAKDTLAGYLRPPEHGYRCKDGYFLLDMLLSRKVDWYPVFAKAVGAEHVLDDTRFADPDSRQDNRDDLIAAMNPYLADWTFDQLAEVIRGAGGTIVRIQDAKTLFADPEGQVAAIGLLRELEHPVVGKYNTLDIPWDFSEHIAELATGPAPTLGQHTKQVLADLGYTEGEIQQISAAGQQRGELQAAAQSR